MPLLKDLVFPRRCLGCSRIDTFLCLDCARELVRISPEKCLFCGRVCQRQLCPVCRRKYQVQDAWSSVYYQEGAAKKMVWALKFQGKKEVAGIMADFLIEKRGHADLDGFTVVPVPLDPIRRRRRGFNQSGAIARHLARKKGLPCLEVLSKAPRMPQAELKKADRLENLSGAYRSIRNVPEKVLLVDDVLTTGATIRECVSVLKANGTKKVVVAVFARD